MLRLRLRSALAALLVTGIGGGAAAAEENWRFAAPAGAYDWSGFYVGGHLGWGWSGLDTEITSPGILVDALHFLGAPASASHDLDGWLAGGHIGLQHQFGRWVVGVEASLTGAPQGFDGSSEAGFAGGFKIPYIAFANWEGESRLSAEISQLFTVTGRLGYAWDRWLGYVKGGYASAKIGVDYDMAGDGKGCLFAHCSAFDFGASASSRERHHGWTLGGGLEYAFMPNVIVGLEYNYIDLGAKTHSANGEAFIDIPRHDDWKDDFHGRLRVDPDAIHTVYARLSFKFGREAAEPVPLK